MSIGFKLSLKACSSVVQTRKPAEPVDDDKTVIQIKRPDEDDDKTRIKMGAGNGNSNGDRTDITSTTQEYTSRTSQTSATSTTSLTGTSSTWNKPFEAPQEVAEITIGTVIKGRFRLTEFIGQGGMGDVSMIRYRYKLNTGAHYLSNLTPLIGDEDDLFFVTNKQDFLHMQSSGFNAVLQNPIVTSDVEEDDGSLSVYAQMNGIRYINIEAEREYQNKGKNHLPMQIKMLNYTLSLH